MNISTGALVNDETCPTKRTDNVPDNIGRRFSKIYNYIGGVVSYRDKRGKRGSRLSSGRDNETRLGRVNF